MDARIRLGVTSHVHCVYSKHIIQNSKAALRYLTHTLQTATTGKTTECF